MSITINKKFLNKLFQKVKNNEITIDQYQNILLNHTIATTQPAVNSQPIKKKEERTCTIEEINNRAHERKKQIKKWKKKNPGNTELEKINSNPDLVQEKIQNLLNKGATVVENPTYLALEDLKENLGKRLVISYILKNGSYRSGGFLTANSDYYFVILGGQITNRISFSVQYSNVKTLYVRVVNKKNAKKPIKPIATTHPKTPYGVKVGNIVVYYAKDNFDKRRFMNTQKYSNMLKYIKKNPG